MTKDEGRTTEEAILRHSSFIIRHPSFVIRLLSVVYDA